MIEFVTLWEYRAKVVSVYDGDTCRVDIDLGFGIWRRDEPLRLLGIDAPEVRGAERLAGLIARDALSQRVLEKVIYIRTVKPTSDKFPGHDMREKYGRYLATLIDNEGNVNDWMVQQGYATVWVVT